MAGEDEFELPGLSQQQITDPNPTKAAGRLFYQIGEHLLRDDINDVGWFNYHGRKTHFYNGKPAPDHPSPLHHWPVGIFGMLVGTFLGVVGELQEIQHDMQGISMNMGEGEFDDDVTESDFS